MFDLILACIIGVLCGVVTGLIPGIHVNTVGAFIFASSSFLLASYSPEVLCVFLISMAISHALLEFIPSMFLGVPEEGTVLSVLPGHQLLLEGRGKEAVRLAAAGGFGAILITVVLLPIFIMILPAVYGQIKPYIWILLVIITIFMFIRLNNNLKSLIWSVVLFLFSGIMGYVMLNSPVSSNVSLLCIFTGLFGVSTLIYSLQQRSFVPTQNKFHHFKINSDILKGIFAGGVSGSILGFLPGFGPAQGSLIAQELIGGGDFENNNESFITALSGVNTADTLFSLVMIFLIGNPRSGTAVYVKNILENFDFNHLIFFVFTALTAVSISVFLCLKLGDIVSELIEKINYRKLLCFVIIFMSLLVVGFSLWYHVNLFFMLIVYLTAIALGLLPHYLGVNKSNLMGVLIVPAIAVYFNLGF
ncbi:MULTISPECIES: tripartite tricarboxylate transporter permease [Methanobacterium]|uniref:Tripartite tricarboxylate transporter permease n=1 Tax=Methanobacterium veterum TaxID=408577 RepID=A0A9E5DM85_9EURY|nr:MULTISPECIES: tripartite tricarboxylate transporter permease [Methanobacterium]MCZ3366430.1 tripartite tricarboxylate transporter permease [Methanobacterium veterum]MCZ3371938.1 tripartite tricarboxylate transporter permease [Methanobacterium veterum]